MPRGARNNLRRFVVIVFDPFGVGKLFPIATVVRELAPMLPSARTDALPRGVHYLFSRLQCIGL